MNLAPEDTWFIYILLKNILKSKTNSVSKTLFIHKNHYFLPNYFILWMVGKAVNGIKDKVDKEKWNIWNIQTNFVFLSKIIIL